jgi:hypothetical protein
LRRGHAAAARGGHRIGDRQLQPEQLRAALQAGNGDLRELLVAITQTSSFQYRRTTGGQP